MAVYAIGALVAIWLSSTVVGAINGVPLVRVRFLPVPERDCLCDWGGGSRNRRSYARAGARWGPGIIRRAAAIAAAGVAKNVRVAAGICIRTCIGGSRSRGAGPTESRRPVLIACVDRF